MSDHSSYDQTARTVADLNDVILDCTGASERHACTHTPRNRSLKSTAGSSRQLLSAKRTHSKLQAAAVESPAGAQDDAGDEDDFMQATGEHNRDNP